MPYKTEGEIRTALADELKRAGGAASLQAWWDTIVPRSLEAAKNDIRGWWGGIGYTTAQVDSWDRLTEVHEHLSLYWCLVNGGVAATYDPQYLDRLDRRKDFKDMRFTIGGVFVSPGGGDELQDVGGGRLDSTGWRFNLDTRF